MSNENERPFFTLEAVAGLQRRVCTHRRGALAAQRGGFSGINLQSISFSCTGKYVATGGFYFRHAHPDVQIDLSDLDNLTLQEYDRLCGVERRYFTVREMAHKRQAYDQRRKEFRKFCKQRDLEEKRMKNNTR